MIDDYIYYTFNMNFKQELLKGNWAYPFNFYYRGLPMPYLMMYPGHLIGGEAVDMHRWRYLLMVFTSFLVYRCSRRIGFSAMKSWVPVFLFALPYPVVVNYIRIGSMEVPGILFGFLFILCWLRLLDASGLKSRILWIVLGTLSYCGAVLSKELMVLYIVIPFSSLGLWLLFRRRMKDHPGWMNGWVSASTFIAYFLMKFLVNHLQPGADDARYTSQYSLKNDLLTSFRNLLGNLWNAYGIILLIAGLILIFWWIQTFRKKQEISRLLHIATVMAVFSLVSVILYIPWPHTSVSRYLILSSSGLCLFMGIVFLKAIDELLKIIKNKNAPLGIPWLYVHAILILVSLLWVAAGTPRPDLYRIVILLWILFWMVGWLKKHSSRWNAGFTLFSLVLLLADFGLRNASMVYSSQAVICHNDIARWRILESMATSIPPGHTLYIDDSKLFRMVTDRYFKLYFKRMDVKYKLESFLDPKNAKPGDYGVCYYAPSDKYLYHIKKGKVRFEVAHKEPFSSRGRYYDHKDAMKQLPGFWQKGFITGDFSQCKRSPLPYRLDMDTFIYTFRFVE